MLLVPIIFRNLFKEDVRMSFIIYLNKLRIGKAKKLLKNNDLNIAENCYQIGYNVPNYFICIFKRYKKLPPEKFRKHKYEYMT